MQLANLRIALAEAKIALRAAKDYETIARAIAEQAAIGELNGSAGKNEAERARNLTIALYNDNYYQNSLTALRDAEAKVERLNAEIAVAEDEVRANEARIREKLADALMGRRVDDAAADTHAPHGSLIRQRIERGGYEDDHWDAAEN